MNEEKKPGDIIMTTESDGNWGEDDDPNSFKMLTKTAGTLAFAAPERIGDNVYYTEKIDVWSSGIVLIMMLTGQHPFNTDDPKELFKHIFNGEMIVENMIDDQEDKLSTAAINLVKDMIKNDPRERLSAKQALQSKWMVTKVRVSEPLAEAKDQLR